MKMHKGKDFLRAQVSNAVMQHRALVDNLTDHAKQAEDARYKQLCEQWLPKVTEHQYALEAYRATLGEVSGEGLKGFLGSALGKARDAVDALREDDFLRIVGDVVTIRQSQDTFATFAAVGDKLGEPKLAELGRHCAADHARMAEEFNLAAQESFVRNAQAVSES
jgi:hypothetical protein